MEVEAENAGLGKDVTPEPGPARLLKQSGLLYNSQVLGLQQQLLSPLLGLLRPSGFAGS